MIPRRTLSAERRNFLHKLVRDDVVSVNSTSGGAQKFLVDQNDRFKLQLILKDPTGSTGETYTVLYEDVDLFEETQPSPKAPRRKTQVSSPTLKLPTPDSGRKRKSKISKAARFVEDEVQDMNPDILAPQTDSGLRDFLKEQFTLVRDTISQSAEMCSDKICSLESAIKDSRKALQQLAVEDILQLSEEEVLGVESALPVPQVQPTPPKHNTFVGAVQEPEHYSANPLLPQDFADVPSQQMPPPTSATPTNANMPTAAITRQSQLQQVQEPSQQTPSPSAAAGNNFSMAGSAFVGQHQLQLQPAQEPLQQFRSAAATMPASAFSRQPQLQPAQEPSQLAPSTRSMSATNYNMPPAFTGQSQQPLLQAPMLTSMSSPYQLASSTSSSSTTTYSSVARHAGKRQIFSWHLCKNYFFQENELRGRNCRGVGGKDALDPPRLAEVRRLTFEYFPVSPVGDVLGEAVAWKECIKAIDKGIRTYVK